MKLTISYGGKLPARLRELLLPVTADGEVAAPHPLEDVLEGIALSGDDGHEERLGLPDVATPVRTVGIGDDPLDRESLSALVAVGASRARSAEGRVALCLPEEADLAIATEAAIRAGYRFDRYKSKTSRSAAELVLVCAARRTRAAAAQVETGTVVGEAVNLAREIGDLPPNDLGPVELAALARREARRAGVSCRVLDGSAIAKLGMNALLSVAAGSARPARFLVLDHKPRGASGPPIVFVGKAITFDTGGISLKPREGMEAMKFDLGGGAAVIGALTGIGRLGIKRRVVGLVPVAENMPGGSATRPGDVVTTASGLTVEIHNTDAEGRLILADALHHAKSFKPGLVVDLATLTGAVVVSLGHTYAGCFTRDSDLADRVKDAGGAVGEAYWHMPIHDDYATTMKGAVADLRNSAGRAAGSCLAAAFLEAFTDYPWVHLDIAGMANTSRSSSLQTVGATGFGVRTLIELARRDP